MLALFDQLFELIPDALILVDTEGVVVKANQRARSMFGYGNGDLLGGSIERLLPPQVRERHRHHRESYMRHPRIRPMGAQYQTLQGLRRNGEVFPVEIALSPLRSGDARFYLASVRDTSSSERVRQSNARKRHDRLVARVAEMAATASDEQALIQWLPREVAEALHADAVALVSGRCDLGECRLLAQTGLGQLEATDLPYPAAMLLPGHDRIDDGSGFWDASDPDPAGRDFTALRDAHMRSALVVPLAERSGLSGAIVVLSGSVGRFDQDSRYCLVSVASLLSSFLRRLRSEEQLAHAQRLEAIGKLTGGIAHDFNNLLTVVSGNLQLIEMQSGAQPPVNRMAREARRAVDSAAELTSKLLTFASRQHLRPSWFDLDSLLADLVTMLRRTLGESIGIELDMPDDLPRLHVDRGQLESALVNLAFNARDAMPGGGRLQIVVSQREIDGDLAHQHSLAAGPFLCIAVRDNGVGMPPEVMERAFEPFYSTKGKGNGLGLSMVYGFVRQSGGFARVQSQPGAGTTIELLLPVAVDAASHQATVGAAESGLPPDLKGRGERLLIVEDDPAVRSVTMAFLESLGYDVEALDNAELALARLARAPAFDLVLSDVVLGPGLDGAQLALALQKSHPQLPVLLMSGYAESSLPLEDLPPASREVLAKPFRHELLARRLRDLLDQAAAASDGS